MMFNIKLQMIALLALLYTGSLSAQENFTTQDNSHTASSSKTEAKPYSDVITGKAITRKGLFDVHKVDDKYFFEINDSLLGRELLLTNWLVKVPGGSPKYGGEVVNTKTFSFDKSGNKIYMNLVSTVNMADSGDAIYKAVRNANNVSMGMSFEIKAKGPGNNSYVIDVTDLFQKENAFSTLDGQVKGMLGLSALASDRSYIESIHSYPINIEVKTMRTYAASPVLSKPGMPPAIPIEAAKESGSITLELSTSIMLMPKVPMQPRHFDNRVGYFGEGYKVYSDKQQKVDENFFIVRQRLEPKEEDIEKYKRGELVEPKQQIVYYVDPATPKQWRPYIIAGINDWNKAFEQAGFKNAIAGKEWPEGDTTMSLEDARYKVVRYLPSETLNAYGPNIHDPRSGEVLQSYVGWYHNIMKLMHDWYFVQMAATDSRARKMKFDDELMGSLIRFAVSHEIGHTLGLRHNMGASSQTPVEKLRDKAWVEAHGHTISIMDYARFNYVAQPGDGIGDKGIMPRIGDYDKWAIQWGYRYTGAGTEDADTKIISKWVVDSLKADPRLWFGGEGRNFDPRSQAEDLGDNSVKASEYGIKNLKIIAAHIVEWTKEDNDTYKNLLEMWREVFNQFLRYSTHVATNIGGTYETFKTVEQPGDVYTPVPAPLQKEAVSFLNKEVFQTPTWLLNSDIVNKLSSPVRMGSVQFIQKRMLEQLLSDRVLFTLVKTYDRNSNASLYTIEEFLSDLKKGIWSELGTNQSIDIYRRDLQKNYVAQIFRAMREAEFSTNGLAALFGPTMQEILPVTSNSDIPSFLALHLEKLRIEIIAAAARSKDTKTMEHLKYLADTIKSGLDNRFTPIPKK